MCHLHVFGLNCPFTYLTQTKCNQQLNSTINLNNYEINLYNEFKFHG